MLGCGQGPMGRAFPSCMHAGRDVCGWTSPVRCLERGSLSQSNQEPASSSPSKGGSPAVPHHGAAVEADGLGGILHAFLGWTAAKRGPS